MPSIITEAAPVAIRSNNETLLPGDSAKSLCASSSIRSVCPLLDAAAFAATTPFAEDTATEPNTVNKLLSAFVSVLHRQT